jgi:hypothetical protein
MSARKLSRLAGLVFVLAAVFGGGSAYASGAEHGTGGSTIVTEGKGATSGLTSSSPGGVRTFELDWT